MNAEIKGYSMTGTRWYTVSGRHWGQKYIRVKMMKLGMLLKYIRRLRGGAEIARLTRKRKDKTLEEKKKS